VRDGEPATGVPEEHALHPTGDQHSIADHEQTLSTR
jgi:hypothetical protein